ncbi:COMM domain-containing protein 10 isoform X1 [Centropristis striata]|uniref:COMM domain-containing protein 10 isoform X1 n=1 Tax=Centropristis striata TaxID=184440 RepID=UPI0027E129FC|nr:COMM domain-containing protein 10 isoform X1 [Centropristis striata]
MTSLIKETESIKEAVTFINAIDVNKFSRLISRIIQKLHLKGERTFSEEEEEKLQAALSLDKQALSLVLETAAFMLEQAVYHNVKPASLQQQLEAIHLNPDKAEVFSQTWATAGPELVEKLKHSTFAPKKLEYVGWQLNLQMAQSSQAKLKSPSAVLQLGLRNEDSEVMLIPSCSQTSWTLRNVKQLGFEFADSCERKSAEKQRLTEVQENAFINFNHQELLDFYNKLEIVQGQLDSLT